MDWIHVWMTLTLDISVSDHRAGGHLTSISKRSFRRMGKLAILWIIPALSRPTDRWWWWMKRALSDHLELTNAIGRPRTKVDKFIEMMKKFLSLPIKINSSLSTTEWPSRPEMDKLISTKAEPACFHLIYANHGQTKELDLQVKSSRLMKQFD